MITHRAVAAAAMMMLPISLGVKVSFSLVITPLFQRFHAIVVFMSFMATVHRICLMAVRMVFSMCFTPFLNKIMGRYLFRYLPVYFLRKTIYFSLALIALIYEDYRISYKKYMIKNTKISTT